MNCPENKKNRWGGDGSFRGSKNQKSGKFQELPRKSIHFFKPSSEDGEREGTGREKGRERQAGKERPERSRVTS